jgi:hypothetical protein
MNEIIAVLKVNGIMIDYCMKASKLPEESLSSAGHDATKARKTAPNKAVKECFYRNCTKKELTKHFYLVSL